MVEGLEGYSYEDRLRILGLTTIETRFLWADLIEVFKTLRGFENLDPDRFKKCNTYSKTRTLS